MRGAEGGATHVLGASEAPTESARWKELTHAIERCRACPLHRSRSRVVIYRGGSTPRVVLVGEAPGAEEDRQGLPFVGRAGKRVDAALARVGLAPADVGMINLIKCRPPSNRFVPASAASCHPFLDRQLELLRPRLIIPLGAHALHEFLPSAEPVTRAAGRLVHQEGRWIYPMIHPAAPLHSPKLRARWDADVGRLAELWPSLLETL